MLERHCLTKLASSCVVGTVLSLHLSCSFFVSELSAGFAMLPSNNASFPGREVLEIEGFPLQAACALEIGLAIRVDGAW